MKKFLLSLLVSVIAVNMASAQTYYQGNSSAYNRQSTSNSGFYHNVQPYKYLGVRIGGAFTGVSFSGKGEMRPKDGSMQSGISGGVIYGVALTDATPLYFETGLLYVEKGGKGKIAGTKYTYNLNYFDIPFVVKYIYSPDGTLTIQPFLGGYMGLGISGKTKFNEEDSYNSYTTKDEKLGFRRFDTGVRFGCGVGYNIIYAELAYEVGLANICRANNISAHNRGLQLTFGLNF